MTTAASPLREVTQVTQSEGALRRRWFSCPTLDLFVWIEEGTVRAFEICYGKPRDEHSLRWVTGEGFVHARIDDGEASPFRNHTPIAIPDGSFDLSRIARDFEQVGGELEADIARFVMAHLRADREPEHD